MFRRAIRLPFTILGIPVLLDLSLLLILPLLAWVIGSQMKEFARTAGLPVDTASLEHGALPYLLGLVAAVGLFVSVLIHELGHSIVARLYGVQVRSITLWLLGGVAQMPDMPRQRGGEAVVAIVGPITSFLLAVLFWGIFRLFPGQNPAWLFLLAYLAEMNLVLAIFNLLPALPLDGGRVLRSLLALKLSRARATAISVSISKGLAILLGFYGLIANPWLILIALFIFMAASAETELSLADDLLEGIHVTDLMTREVKTVSPQTSVGELTRRMLHEHVMGYPVVDGELRGIVTLKDLQGATPDTPVDQIMSPNPTTVPTRASAMEAFRQMSLNGFARLVVTDDQGHVEGIITKTDLMRAIQLRMSGLMPQLHH